MKASLVFVFVLVLIIGITIPSGVIAAAIPKPALPSLKENIDSLKSAASTIEALKIF